jgi:hypothetical protein
MVIENAMRASLANETTRRVAYFFESLDAYRFSMESLEPEFLALLKKKYGALRIDVVVAVSRPAIEFFERHGGQLWPGARVVYNAFSARRVVVVSGASEVERSAAQLARDSLSMSDNQAPVEFLCLPLKELLVRVAAEAADAIIIYLTQYRDAKCHRDGLGSLRSNTTRDP